MKPRTSRRAPGGTTTVTSVPSSRSDGRSRWSKWTCETRAASIPRELVRVERHAPPEVPDPGAKDGVRQQADPVQLDQYGRVPDVEKPARDGLRAAILLHSSSPALRCPDPLTAAIVRLHPIGVIETRSRRAIKARCGWSLPASSPCSACSWPSLSLLAGYIRFQGLDTDTVTETAGDLIADDEIRDQVAASLVDALYANIDVAAALEERLPPDQKGLAGPAAAGLREFSERAATRMLERPRVQALWVNTVTRAHTQLINVLDDDVGPLSTENGAVVLDLQPLVIQLGERVAVVGDVAEKLGPDAGRSRSWRRTSSRPPRT